MSDERHKVMIFRRLATGCESCNLSLNACAASKSMNQEPCCDACSGHGS